MPLRFFLYNFELDDFNNPWTQLSTWSCLFLREEQHKWTGTTKCYKSSTRLLNKWNEIKKCIFYLFFILLSPKCWSRRDYARWKWERVNSVKFGVKGDKKALANKSKKKMEFSFYLQLGFSSFSWFTLAFIFVSEYSHSFSKWNRPPIQQKWENQNTKTHNGVKWKIENK